MKNKQSILFLSAVVAGGNYYAMAMHLIAGIIVGRYVSPKVLGEFNAYGLVLGYLPFLQLGILNGMSREIPYYIGKGDVETSRQWASTGLFCSLLIGGAVALALLGMGVNSAIRSDMKSAIGWVSYAFLGFMLFYSTLYLQTTYRTSQDFARLAIVKVLESTLSVLLIVAVVMWGFYGLCLKAVLVTGLSSLVLYVWRPIRVSAKWDFIAIKHLFKIGCPIFIVGQVYSYWGVIISTVLLVSMGKESLGLYSVVSMSILAMETIPVAIGQIVYPKMAQEWGRGHSVEGLVHVAYKPIIYSFIGMIPCLILATICVRPAVMFLIPKYEGAIPAIKWGIWISLISSLSPINHIFNVIKKQGLYLFAIIAGIGSTFAVLKLLLAVQPSLVSFPQALLVGRFLFMSLCLLCIYYVCRREKIRSV